MSLLMDALKRAEHAKRDKQTETTPLETPAAKSPVEETSLDLAELSLSPVDDHAHADTPALEPVEKAAPRLSIATSPEPVPAQQPPLESTPKPAVTPPPAAENKQSEPSAAPEVSAPAPAKPDHHNAQAAARILAASAARHESQRRRNMIGLVGLGAVLVIAIGSYYYYASLAQQTPHLGMAQSPPAATEENGESAAEAPDDLQTALLDGVPPAQTPWQEGPPPAAPLVTQDWEPAPVDPRVIRGEQPLPSTYQAEEDAPAEPAAAGIRITRSTQPNKVSLDLQTAYADFQAGRLAQAEQGYRQVLARDDGSRDARMGLAAIAVRNGQMDIARAQYQRVLQRNPKDLTARAALTDLGQDRSADSESQLKLLLAEQPQSAQLHFALANLYAEQQRWPYAQQAYFEAQRLAPEHPDYAFNLAVSLEHLSQPRLALEYYQRAVQLAGRHSAQFDLRAAQQRVAVLSAQVQP